MLSPAKVAVIIPCFNEARFIGSLVTEIRGFIPTVIVVDDHSTDATATLARQAGAEVLTNKQQLGKGGALLAGLEQAHARGYEWALLMDGDNQHSPMDISRFLEAEPHQALVIGDRMHSPEAMPWLRRQVNRWMSKRISGLAGCHLPDTQCGFRRINLQAWKNTPLRSQRFEIESEMVVAFASAGFKVGFVSIQVLYRSEQSKIRPLADTIRWFRWYFQTRRTISNRKGTPHTPVLASNSAPLVR